MKSFFPIPADALVGMYHPFRDFFVNLWPRGFPFKNFLITDPVRQQYPWRWLAIKSWQVGHWPGWNPYQLTGSPLLANFQSGSFYPLNFLFFLPADSQGFFNFNFGWAILVFLQPLLAAIFMFLFLRNLKLGRTAAFLGGLAFAFSGFMVAWLEWGTIGQAALWLPLILLAIDKIIGRQGCGWSFIFVFSLACSFFAGHLQTAFYVILASAIYIIWRLFQIKKRKKIIKLFTFYFLLFTLATAIQWLPTFRLIERSGRGADLNWHQPGWFIPWPHLVQFLAPDFFGNPTTLNYWGEWNYGEFIGFIGIIPLVLALSGIFVNKKTKFFAWLALISLSFALSTPWAKLIYQLKIPFLSTSQPTRLLFLVDFSLAVLAAFGWEKLIKNKTVPWRWLTVISAVFLLLWLVAFCGGADPANLPVARRNLILPTAILVGLWLLVAARRLISLPRWLFISSLLLLICFDLLRFAKKFTPFSPAEFIFPKTKTIEFLQQRQTEEQPFRIMGVDDRILAPNFSAVYHLEDVSGYDPLYLRRYGELVAAIERDKPDISAPFGFNRIITLHNYQSKLVDFLNVRYLLSLEALESEKLDLVFEEGETKIYENKQFFPRAFLVNNYQVAKDQQEVIELMMSEEIDLSQTAILEEKPALTIEQCNNLTMGDQSVEITSYTPNQIKLQVNSPCPALLILSDAFYPGWSARVNGQEAAIYRANYHYRAIVVPASSAGQTQVEFSY